MNLESASNCVGRIKEFEKFFKGDVMNFFLLNVGKMLFPDLPRDLRRRRMSVIFLTAFISVVVAGIVALVILKSGRPFNR
jgi:hypothetical protein